MPLLLPSGVNEQSSMDFVSDQLASHRRFRVLNVVDDFSRELIGQFISISISGQQVARFLNQLIETSIKLNFIQPGKPTQNTFVEGLNGKFRNECLNQHWFRSLAETRYEIDKWREH